jgi:hypothetical protein
MSLSFLSRNRTVLLICDEALFIYSASNTGVELVGSIEWENADFEKVVVDTITKKCGRKPVLILNDMVEQHYRKEKVVKVGAGLGDKASMVKRKLNVAFPNYPVRAAFPLKEKIKKSEGQLAADIYIFAAVPNSTQFNQTMSVTSKSLASVAGFCLLPVESSDMLKALSEKLSKSKKGGSAKWCVFIGQHRNGGLRQIVTKNGEIALTRMTPVADVNESAQKWAAEVHQEYKSTMSYLARFGFVPEDSLDVIVISNSDAGDMLNTMVGESDVRLHTMTPAEAAQLLNIRLGRQDNAHFADTLHVAWGAKKGSFILPMRATKVDEVSKPRQVAMLASVLLGLSGAYLAYEALANYEAYATVIDDLEQAKKRKAQLDIQYQKELAKKEKLGFNVKLVQASIRVRDKIESENIQTLDFFAGIGRALGKDLRIDSLDLQALERPKSKSAVRSYGAVNKEDKEQPLYETRVQMTYPSTTDIDKGNQEVQSLGRRLSRILDGYDVEVTKLLKDYEYTEGLVVEAGDLDKTDLNQDFLAEITIRGPMKKEPEKP